MPEIPGEELWLENNEVQGGAKWRERRPWKEITSESFLPPPLCCPGQAQLTALPGQAETQQLSKRANLGWNWNAGRRWWDHFLMCWWPRAYLLLRQLCLNTNLTSATETTHSPTLTQTFSGEETLTFLVISYFGRRHSSNFFNTLQIYFPFHDNPLSAGLFPCVKHKWLFSYSLILWYFHALNILPIWTLGTVVFIGNYVNPKSGSRPTQGWQFNFQSNLKHTHHDLTMTMNIGSCTGKWRPIKDCMIGREGEGEREVTVPNSSPLSH